MTATTSPATSTRTRSLFQHWIHSREEDLGLVEVYRPEGFAFPPSFGRDGFAMRADGGFVQEDVGPADELIRTRGRWTMAEPWVVSVELAGRTADDQPRRLAFEILSVDDDVLRIIRRDPGEIRRPSILIDFERARVFTTDGAPPELVLEVRGTKPSAGMKVSLAPLTYVRQPEYWEIEVRGTAPEIDAPVLTPYEVTLPVTSAMGTRGIEVVGASTRERIDVTSEGCP